MLSVFIPVFRCLKNIKNDFFSSDRINVVATWPNDFEIAMRHWTRREFTGRSWNNVDTKNGSSRKLFNYTGSGKICWMSVGPCDSSGPQPQRRKILPGHSCFYQEAKRKNSALHGFIKGPGSLLRRNARDKGCCSSFNYLFLYFLHRIFF